MIDLLNSPSTPCLRSSGTFYQRKRSDISTLQIWPTKDAPSSSLLAHVSCIPDLRFPRRYVCVTFVISQNLEDIQSNWQATFDSNMDKANQLIQALSRTAIDRTTTYRFSYDKAFDISNTKFPSSTFPYPILFMDMSQSLANLLAAHPQLPLQGALGLSKLLISSFTTTRSTQAPTVRTPSPEEKALLLQKVLSPTKENNPRVDPRAPTRIDPLIKLSMAEDLMTTLIQDPQDPHIEQEKPDLPLSTARAPTTTSHQINLRTDNGPPIGPNQLQCVPPAIVSLGRINSALLVIKLHYQTPSTPRSPCQSLTIGAQVSSKMENNALNSLDKDNAHYVNFISSSSRTRRTSINKSYHPPLNGQRSSSLTSTSTSLKLLKKTPLSTTSRNLQNLSPWSTTSWNLTPSPLKIGHYTSSSSTTSTPGLMIGYHFHTQANYQTKSLTFRKINQTSSTQDTLSVRDSSPTTSLHASGIQKTSASSSGTARRPSWTTGRSPSRTTQTSTLKELYASLGTS